jgi:hypothetical protein
MADKPDPKNRDDHYSEEETPGAAIKRFAQ